MKPLNPIMAVLVIASVGASPLRTLAADGVATAPASTAEDKNPLNALTRILSENPAARADAGKRFEDFLLKPDSGGKSFVAFDVDAKALGAVAREWGEKKGAVGGVSVLYFVAGPGAATPGWALKDPILSKTFVPGMKWEGRLRTALADWTGKSQIDKKREKSQVTAFLTDAAAKASTVFADSRTKQEIDLSIEGNNTTAPVVPDTRRSPGSRLDGASRQYTLEDLYEDGSVVTNVSGPGDANSRRISMKIYTKRLPDGSVVNEIGIFDITDRNDIFGRRFPIDSGKQSFTLDDRTKGHKTYELSFGEADKNGNRTISFARPGDGGAPLKTNVSELFNRRADQAAAMANIVNVGGEDFYTLPQGGRFSGLALFPKALIDARSPAGDPRDLVPALYADVGKRGSDGRNAHLDGKPHLGKVGAKEFHLEFNKAAGVWEVKDGPGDPPPATDDGAAPGGANPGGANPGGTNPGGTNPTAPGEGGMSIADLETLLLKSPECKKNPDDVKDLAAGLKGKYGIVSCNSPIDGLQQIILVPKTASTPGQQLRYGNVSGFKLQRARFFDHYLVLQFDKQVQYLDLLKMDKDADGKEGGFALSGFVSEKNASKFADANAFVDALRNYMGIAAGSPDAGAFTEVAKRVAQVLPGKPYNLTGGFAKDVLVVAATSGGLQYNIWPKIIMPGGDTVPTPNPYTSLSGPANAMDGAVSSVDDKFPAEFETADKRIAKQVAGKVSADIALYEAVDPIGKDTEKKYLVMFRYQALDPKEPKIFRQKAFEVFNAANPYPGDGLQLQGLTGGAVVQDRVASGYKFISGSTKEKGVLAVFQNKQVSATNAKDGEANCVGPVIWWGLADRDAALKICQNDKF